MTDIIKENILVYGLKWRILSMNTNPEVSFPFSPQASTSMKKGVPASKESTVKR